MIFCVISKAFDRVWHKGLISKLENIGIKNDLLKWFSDYLSQRQQRVVINGSSSCWNNIMAGVPQESVLGPLLFLIYINDLSDVVQSEIRLFADDTTLYVYVDNSHDSANQLNEDLNKIEI